MNRFLIVLFITLNVPRAPAQNLVPNGSFEEYSACPTMWGRLDYAGWLSPWGSPDYFNACDTSEKVGVPLSNMGFQHAAYGSAYAGMITSAIGGIPWFREIIAVQLTQPLIPGVPICLSFKTAMGGYGNFYGASAIYSCKGLGMQFFTELPADWQTYLYPNSAALSIDEVPSDTSRWYSVSGNYTPDSAYQYVAIGNFFADSLIELTLIDSVGAGGLENAYAFVDDVRASFDLSYCTTSLPSGGVTMRAATTHPMPCADALNLSFSSAVVGSLKYRLLAPSGQLVRDGTLLVNGSRASVDLTGLSGGHFVLHLTDGAGAYRAIQVVRVSP